MGGGEERPAVWGPGDRTGHPDRDVRGLAGVLTMPVWSNVADTWLGSVRTLQVVSIAEAAAALALLPSGSHVWVILVLAAVLGAAGAPHRPSRTRSRSAISVPSA